MHFLPEYEYKSKRYTFHKGLSKGLVTLMDVEGPGIIKHIWMTFSLSSKWVGRSNIIRIYWDGETEPSVEAPITDFFGAPMGLVGNEFQMNSYFLTIVPNNGFNCYFQMPFHKSARIELEVNVPQDLYFQVDYELCSNGLPKRLEHLRFHAKYRLESPTESYGYPYTVLDAEGSGYFMGATFGIRRIKEQNDAWYHGRGDIIYADGETDPDVIHGIGGEDYFGHSWGTDISSTLYVGNPLYQRLNTDTKRGLFNLVLYRFHVHDPIRFKSSLTFMLGAMGDSISSVAYWYQIEPHRNYFQLPDVGSLQQDSVVPRLSHDILPEYTHIWNVYGPIRDEEPLSFQQIHPLEIEMDLNFTSEYAVPHKQADIKMETKWSELLAPRGFADFHVRMRPEIEFIHLQTECYGFASGFIDLPEDLNAYIRVGFDDALRLYVNNEVLLDEHHPDQFSNEIRPVSLKKGRNTVLIKLSNYHNTNFRSWAFHFAIVDDDNRLLRNVMVNSK